MVNVCWTGAAGLEFNYRGKTILIDPYYSRISLLNIFFGNVKPDLKVINQVKAKKNSIQAIIAGHTHFDHVMDIPEFAKNSDCLVIGSKSLETLMKLSKMKNRTMVCQGNERIQIDGDASVDMIPSVHGLVAFGRVPFQGEISSGERIPMPARSYRVGDVFVPKLNIMGASFLHLGSAGFTESELEKHTADVVFLCVPGWKKAKDYPERIIDILKPQVVVLFHYDAFYKKLYKKITPKLKFLEISEMVKKINKVSPGVKVVIPELFEEMEF